MPLAVALLCHPVGTFASLVVAIVAALYAAQSPRFVTAFTAASATLLTGLAWLQMSPSCAGLAALCAGVALLHLEFLWPTFGAAGAAGFAAAGWGSWSLLVDLPPWPRAAVALVGTALLAAAVARTMRLRTLPRTRGVP